MRRRSLAGLALASLLVMPASAATAAGVAVENAWVRAAAPGAPNGAAYVTLVNRGAKADRLIGASSPIARSVEIHEMRMDGQVMRMRMVSGGVAVPAGGRAELKPGGLHLMLMGLKQPLKAGERADITLRFENAGAVTTAFEVRAQPGAPAVHNHGAHH